MRELKPHEHYALVIEGHCPFCGNRVFYFGPRGAESRNITCIACNAGYNVVMLTSMPAQLIAEPHSDGSQGEPPSHLDS